jgi:hypothetical protein
MDLGLGLGEHGENLERSILDPALERRRLFDDSADIVEMTLRLRWRGLEASAARNSPKSAPTSSIAPTIMSPLSPENASRKAVFIEAPVYIVLGRK